MSESDSRVGVHKLRLSVTLILIFTLVSVSNKMTYLISTATTVVGFGVKDCSVGSTQSWATTSASGCARRNLPVQTLALPLRPYRQCQIELQCQPDEWSGCWSLFRSSNRHHLIFPMASPSNARAPLPIEFLVLSGQRHERSGIPFVKFFVSAESIVFRRPALSPRANDRACPSPPP